MGTSVHFFLTSSIPSALPTRQTSSSGRPKSPRVQVVLPEELCDRLAELAERESRTVSNMARVLIQQGVERMEREGVQAASGRLRGAMAGQTRSGAAPRRRRGAPTRIRLPRG